MSAQRSRRSPREWWAAQFGLDADWQRPRAQLSRWDLVLAVSVALYGVLGLEFFRSAGGMGVEADAGRRGWEWLAVGSGALLLVGRRRWPLTVALLGAAHMFVVGITMPEVMAQLALQLVYFFTLLSGVAWARSRWTMVWVTVGIVVFMAGWVGWQLVDGAGKDSALADQGVDTIGWFGPYAGAVGYTILINVVYFGGAIVAGAGSWRGAHQRAQLSDQARTITAQSEALSEQAVVTERLRIARELHDVVAHHVAAIGVQAGAARRVLQKQPGTPAPALGALSNIEQASRDAVSQMRSLLGTLRERGERSLPASTASDPSVADLSGLVAAAALQGVQVEHRLVEAHPGSVQHLDPGLLLSAHRTVGEALTNVARHSTASRAQVTIRHVEEPAAYLEVEVLDEGRPRGGTSGSGLGQLGIRERAATHHGEVELGPRVTGGYRVRVRFPIARSTS